MKTIVAVEDFEAMRKRSLERARRLDRREPVEAERRISFELPEDMASFLTSRRINVLKAAMERPRSVSELALALRRNRPAVSRDVRALNLVGLVELNKHTNPGHGQVQIVKAAAKSFEFRYQLSA
ncbi:MAG: ArsR family transcriptional regulator [Acidobacteriota bacterium]